jgi:hypothetical protein
MRCRVSLPILDLCAASEHNRSVRLGPVKRVLHEPRAALPPSDRRCALSASNLLDLTEILEDRVGGVGGLTQDLACLAPTTGVRSPGVVDRQTLNITGGPISKRDSPASCGGSSCPSREPYRYPAESYDLALLPILIMLRRNA